MLTGEPASRLIDGRFELLQHLGGGGMGVVWRARDNALHREVALKEVRSADPAAGDVHSVDSGEVRQRVLREARALAQLRHPNVVVIHHIVDTPEHPHPWLVMELVTGGNLADRLERGPLSVPEAARIGRGVLSALAAAHAVGIMHRDIKPANVLLRTDGSPVLTDFGIAAVRDSTALTVSGSVIGSPEYIAPERLRGEEGNPSSDLWSLGMMLYVAVEGRHPLRRATMIATLAAVLDEPLPAPVNAGPLGPALAAILARSPGQRPNAEQFDRLLAAAEYGHDAPPLPPGPTPWAQTPTPVPGPVTGPSGTTVSTPGAFPIPAAPLPSAAPMPTGPNPMGPANYQPTAGEWMTGNWPTGDWSPSRLGRSRGRGRAVWAVVSVVVLVAAGVLVWVLLPRPAGASGGSAASGGPTGTGHTSAPATPTRPGSRATTATTNQATTPPVPKELLTPAGARAVVNAMTPVMGKKVIRLVIYPDYASAEAPTAADPKLYDDVNYRDGTTTRAPGGEIDTTTDGPIDLSAVNWDALPALLDKAAKSLNIPHPTDIYVIIDSDMEINDNGDTTLTPVINIFRADDYGGGYVMADLSGKVLKTVPRS